MTDGNHSKEEEADRSLFLPLEDSSFQAERKREKHKTKQNKKKKKINPF